jgi:hypothetical protein
VLSWTQGTVQPALDKTENSITVLEQNVQRIGKVGNPVAHSFGPSPGPSAGSGEEYLK